MYVGNVIAGRSREMEAIIDLNFKDEKKEEFVYSVSLTMRKYDIHVGTYDTYEEAGEVADNIDKALEELK